MGSVLNERFTLTDIINTGGFSIIYRAEDRLTGESVALKECAPEGLVLRREDGSVEPLDERAEGTFHTALVGMEQEIDALRTLTAAGVSGIPQYLDAFSSHGTLCLAMTEVRGANLHCWAESYRMAGKAFPPSLVESLLTGVLEILENVHANGYYHCDIKPANIIIDENGGIYLIDFGAVRTATRQHQAVQVSPGFTPVELYPGYRASIGPWSDIYMLATLFYNIITGRVPEPANERAQSDRTPRLSTDARLNKLYSAPLLNSIDKAMSVAEVDRYPSARVWLQAYTQRQNGPQLVRSRKRETSAYAAAALDLSRVMRGRNRRQAPTMKAPGAAARTAAATLHPGASLRSSALSTTRPRAAHLLSASPQRPVGTAQLRSAATLRPSGLGLRSAPNARRLSASPASPSPTLRTATPSPSPRLARQQSASAHRPADPADPAASAPVDDDTVGNEELCPDLPAAAPLPAAPGSLGVNPELDLPADVGESSGIGGYPGAERAESSPESPRETDKPDRPSNANPSADSRDDASASAAEAAALAAETPSSTAETSHEEVCGAACGNASAARKMAGGHPASIGSAPVDEKNSNLPYIIACIVGLIAVIIYLFI